MGNAGLECRSREMQGWGNAELGSVVLGIARLGYAALAGPVWTGEVMPACMRDCVLGRGCIPGWVCVPGKDCVLGRRCVQGSGCVPGKGCVSGDGNVSQGMCRQGEYDSVMCGAQACILRWRFESGDVRSRYIWQCYSMLGACPGFQCESGDGSLGQGMCRQGGCESVIPPLGHAQASNVNQEMAV